MQIAFRKMHGLGNDFMVIDARAEPINLATAQIAALADRRTGVGFDQLLMLEPAGDQAVDARYRVFNSDGGEVEQCGNGVRCLALLLSEAQALSRKTIALAGSAGIVTAERVGRSAIRVNMGRPDFSPDALPFDAPASAERYTLKIDGNTLQIGAVSLGNPHAVLTCDTLADAPVDALGRQISVHPRFPRETNVEFMQVEDPQHIRLRVYERGVGETRACGTGACAAVAAGRRWGLLDAEVQVSLPGGTLTINWNGPDTDLYMTGPASDVYGGTIEL